MILEQKHNTQPQNQSRTDKYPKTILHNPQINPPPSLNQSSQTYSLNYSVQASRLKLQPKPSQPSSQLLKVSVNQSSMTKKTKLSNKNIIKKLVKLLIRGLISYLRIKSFSKSLKRPSKKVLPLPSRNNLGSAKKLEPFLDKEQLLFGVIKRLKILSKTKLKKLPEIKLKCDLLIYSLLL